MKVNIAGKGTISLLGITAPIRNKDLTETEIKALLNIGSIKLYDSATGINIGPNNVDSFFHDVTTESDKEVTPVAVTPVEEPKEVVTETETEAPVEEASEEVTEPETDTEKENTVEEPTTEESTEESTEETVSEEELTEETKVEATSNVPNYSSHSKKNKKKR